jgi:hypothetical protein
LVRGHRRAGVAFAAAMKDQGRQDCEGYCRSWRIAICSSDAAKDDSVTFLF